MNGWIGGRVDEYQRGKISFFKIYISVFWSQGDIVYSVGLWQLKHVLTQKSNSCHNIDY